MKNKYISPIVEIYDYITEDVMSNSWLTADNTFPFPTSWWK